MITLKGPLHLSLRGFDEEANPWRCMPAHVRAKEAEAFCEKWSTPEDVLKAFPEVQNCFMPFMNRRERWSPKEIARNIAKTVIQMHSGLPRCICMELACVCPLTCEYCSLKGIEKHRKTKLMSYEDFMKVWEDVSVFTNYVELTGGEPLINPDIYKIIATLRSAGSYIGLSSNAQLLNDDNIPQLLEAEPSHLLLAVDSTEAGKYEASRIGGNFGVLETNLRKLCAEKKRLGNTRTEIIILMVVTKKNYEDKDSIIEFGKAIGADKVRFKPVLPWPYLPDEQKMHLFKNLVPFNKVDSYFELDESLGVKCSKKPEVCPSIRSAWIGCDGSVMPCIFMPNLASSVIGNAVSDKFTDVWFSDRYLYLRNCRNEHGISQYCHHCIGVYKPECFADFPLTPNTI